MNDLTMPLHQAIKYLVKQGYKLEITDKFITVTDKRTDQAVSYDHLHDEPLAVLLARLCAEHHARENKL
jgi:hypothetical protein